MIPKRKEMTKEEALAAIKAELDKWMNHSTRMMEHGGNSAYFQGKITLITDLRSLIYDIEHGDALGGLRTAVEPDEDMPTFQVSTRVSRELMSHLKKDDNLVKMIADDMVQQIKREIAKL